MIEKSKVRLRRIKSNFIKTIDGFLTPIVLFIMNLVFIDSPSDVIFGRIRGLLLYPFIKYKSLPYIGRNVYFLELLTREYIFGENIRILYGCKFHGPITIGSNVFLNYNVEVRSYTFIGDNVSIGPNVLFISDSHEIGDKNHRTGKDKFNKIIIEKGCWIGAGAIILGGVTVGSGAVVAAGAVVTRNVLPNSMVGGVPAKLIKYLE